MRSRLLAILVAIAFVAVVFAFQISNTDPYGDTLQLVWPTESPTVNPCGVK